MQGNTEKTTVQAPAENRGCTEFATSGLWDFFVVFWMCSCGVNLGGEGCLSLLCILLLSCTQCFESGWTPGSYPEKPACGTSYHDTDTHQWDTAIYFTALHRLYTLIDHVWNVCYTIFFSWLCLFCHNPRFRKILGWYVGARVCADSKEGCVIDENYIQPTTYLWNLQVKEEKSFGCFSFSAIVCGCLWQIPT